MEYRILHVQEQQKWQIICICEVVAVDRHTSATLIYSKFRIRLFEDLRLNKLNMKTSDDSNIQF